jgi:hypothetical protein
MSVGLRESTLLGDELSEVWHVDWEQQEDSSSSGGVISDKLLGVDWEESVVFDMAIVDD